MTPSITIEAPDTDFIVEMKNGFMPVWWLSLGSVVAWTEYDAVVIGHIVGIDRKPDGSTTVVVQTVSGRPEQHIDSKELILHHAGN